MCQIGAWHSFVIGRKCNRNVEPAINRKRVIVAFNVQNLIVRCKADLYEDSALGHLVEEIDRIMLVHNGNSVSDSFGVA